MAKTTGIKDISELDYTMLRELYQQCANKAIAALKRKYEELYQIPFLSKNMGTTTKTINNTEEKLTFDQLIEYLHKTGDYTPIDYWYFKGLGGAPQSSKGWSSKLPKNPTLERTIEAATNLKQYSIPDLLQLEETIQTQYNKIRDRIPDKAMIFIKSFGKQYALFKEVKRGEAHIVDKYESKIKEQISTKKEPDIRPQLSSMIEEIYTFHNQIKIKNEPPIPKEEKLSKEFKKRYTPTFFKYLRMYHKSCELEKVLGKVDKEIGKRFNSNEKHSYELEETLRSTLKDTFMRELDNNVRPYLMQYHINLEVRTIQNKFMLITNFPYHAKPVLETLLTGAIPLKYTSENKDEIDLGGFYLAHPRDSTKLLKIDTALSLNGETILNIETAGYGADHTEIPIPIGFDGEFSNSFGFGPSPLTKEEIERVKQVLDAAAKKQPNNLTIKYT